MIFSLPLHLNYTNDRIGEVEFCNGALKDKLVSRVATARALYPRFYIMSFTSLLCTCVTGWLWWWSGSD